MVVYHLKTPRNIFKQILSIIFRFHWYQYLHFYLFFIILFIACLISYRKPFGLLFNLKYIIYEHSSIDFARENFIKQQKHEQKLAYEWLENLFHNPQNYRNLISNQTNQSHFYNYVQLINNNNHSSFYTLLNKPKQFYLNSTNKIVISILYSKQHTDHHEGKFYIGQLLYHLLKNYHSRFIITLCENNNTNEQISDGIKLIRHLLPVFIVNSQSEILINTYEREKQAHLQCILANFQSFSNINYLLLLQDDAKPISENFYYQLLSLIDYRIKQQWPLNGHRQQPAFIKIYHPRWLISYFHPSLYIITQLIATSFLLTFFCFICFYYFKKNNQIQWQYYPRLSLINHKFLSNLITDNINLLYFLFYYLLITLVLILLNHSNVSWTWRSLHPSFYAIYPAPSCCLPGVIYFRQTYIQVIDYLNSVKCRNGYAIDTAFDDLPKRIHLQTYLVEPNLVHHIGLYSRLRHMYINPYLLD